MNLFLMMSICIGLVGIFQSIISGWMSEQNGYSIMGMINAITGLIAMSIPVAEMIFPEGVSFEGTGLHPEYNVELFGLEDCLKRWLES